MKCFRCGCTLSENDFCTSCGADVHIYKKIIYLSNMYYNDGLRKAQVRDLSGAVASLRQSLKCNRNNIEARNLLGLVYFEMGEAVSALSEWVISKNIRPDKNIADDFMQQVQSNPTRLDNINKSIKKYNQALIYCNQGSLDLAVIQLKKVLSMNPNLIVAYQLLGLLYLNSEEWEKAKRTLEKAARIDADNTTVLYYLREANRAIKEREISPDAPARPEKKHSAAAKETISYQSGNETIIQPLNGPERSASSTIINILIGMVIGLAVTWFLILPARVRATEDKVNKQLVDVSNELTAKSADIDELNKRIDALQDENQESKDALAGYTGTSGVLQKYDALCEAALSYIEKPDDILTTAKTLEGISGSTLSVTISSDSASGNQVSGNASGIDSAFATVSGNITYSDAFKNLFKYLSSDVSVKAAKQYLDSGVSAYNKKDYASAITNLETAYNMDPTSDDALFYLAMSYMKSDNAEKATELFSLIANNFPDSQYLSRAKKYLETGATEEAPNAQNTQNTQDTQNTAAQNAAAALLQQAAQNAAAQNNTGDAQTAQPAQTAQTAQTAQPAGQ